MYYCYGTVPEGIDACLLMQHICDEFKVDAVALVYSSGLPSEAAVADIGISLTARKRWLTSPTKLQKGRAKS